MSIDKILLVTLNTLDRTEEVNCVSITEHWINILWASLVETVNTYVDVSLSSMVREHVKDFLSSSVVVVMDLTSYLVESTEVCNIDTTFVNLNYSILIESTCRWLRIIVVSHVIYILDCLLSVCTN